MSVTPPAGYSTSTKTPGFVVGTEFGAGGRSAGSAPMLLALLGNRLAAGTAALDTPVVCASPDDGLTLTGGGSELDEMIQAVFAQYPRANLVIVPVTESAGAAATALALFTGPATTSGTVRLTVCGEFVDVAVAAADTATVIAAAVRDAVLAKTRWPVTASASTGTTTLTCKQRGPRGNNRPLRVELRDGLTGVTVALNGGSASAIRVISKFGAGTGTPGATADDITTALGAMLPKRYDHIAAAHDDTANWTRLASHVSAQSGIGSRLRERAIVADLRDQTTAIADSGGQNQLLEQIVWHYNAENPSGVIAAQVAAGRLWGDGAVGGGVGRSKGEEAKRSANLDGTLLASVREQYDPNDIPTATEIELALNRGLTVLVPSPAHPGFVRIARSITSRWKDAAGNPNYAVLDTSKVEVVHYAADRLEAFQANEFPNKNLRADYADKRIPADPDTVTPSMVRAATIEELQRMEDEGLIVRVAELAPLVTCEVAPDNPGMLLTYIPLDVIDGLHNGATTLSQIG